MKYLPRALLKLVLLEVLFLCTETAHVIVLDSPWVLSVIEMAPALPWALAVALLFVLWREERSLEQRGKRKPLRLRDPELARRIGRAMLLTLAPVGIAAAIAGMVLGRSAQHVAVITGTMMGAWLIGIPTLLIAGRVFEVAHLERPEV